MIYVKLHYGLGNQMFQYAIARRLSIEKKIPFKLDISYFDEQTLSQGEQAREYQLHIFNVQENIACHSETYKYRHPNLLERQIRKFKHYFFPKLYHNFLVEKDDIYDPRVFICGTNVYLFGYWQDERYFKSIEPIIRNDFTFKHLPDKKNSNYLDIITNSNSVSVHVRRTDYITDKIHNQKVGVCSPEYYKDAIQHMIGKIKSPQFFIFSDDPLWAKTNLKIDANTSFMEHNPIEKGYEDLRLMMHCKYHIIANSSFSWWGAWLSNYEQKIVIAPKIWQIQNNQKRILPESWIRM